MRRYHITPVNAYHHIALHHITQVEKHRIVVYVTSEWPSAYWHISLSLIMMRGPIMYAEGSLSYNHQLIGTSVLH